MNMRLQRINKKWGRMNRGVVEDEKEVVKDE